MRVDERPEHMDDLLHLLHLDLVLSQLDRKVALTLPHDCDQFLVFMLQEFDFLQEFLFSLLSSVLTWISIL